MEGAAARVAAGLDGAAMGRSYPGGLGGATEGHTQGAMEGHTQLGLLTSMAAYDGRLLDTEQLVCRRSLE